MGLSLTEPQLPAETKIVGNVMHTLYQSFWPGVCGTQNVGNDKGNLLPFMPSESLN